MCWQLARRIRTEPSWSCSQVVSRPVWHIPLLRVQWKTPDDEQRNCPKHAEFYSKNKFEKSVHLVGFIIRILQSRVMLTGCRQLGLGHPCTLSAEVKEREELYLFSPSGPSWPGQGWTTNRSVYIYIYIYIYIQGVPGGKDLTPGGCSLGQTIPI